MRKIIALVLAALCLLALLAGCAKKEPESPYLKGKHHVEIEVKDYGTIAVELDADTDWRSLAHGTYSQILILCGADTVTAEDGLVSMLAEPSAEQDPESETDT